MNKHSAITRILKVSIYKSTYFRSRFLRRGCDEPIFSETCFFQKKRVRHSMNEGFGKDSYKKGSSMKRCGPFNEPPKKYAVLRKVAVLIPFPKISSYATIAADRLRGCQCNCILSKNRILLVTRPKYSPYRETPVTCRPVFSVVSQTDYRCYTTTFPKILGKEGLF